MNRTRVMTVIAALTLLSACGAGQSEEATGTTVAGPAATSAPPASIAQPAIPDLPKPQTLDLQANHPNGTVMRLTNVSFHDDHIEAQVSVTNGGERPTGLNDFGLLLRDDQGTVYRVAPPSNNPTIDVQQGSTVQLNLVFLGRISPKATSLTLSTNDRLNQDSRFTSSPTIRLGPVPVQR